MATQTTLTTTSPVALYKARAGRVDLVDVPELLFAFVDGEGPPAAENFGRAISGLYAVAYGVRFALRAKGIDEKVSPLEALWTSPDPETDFTTALARGGFEDAEKSSWTWRAMIHLPLAATDDLVRAVKTDGIRRHPEQKAAIDAVQTELWSEGTCVQTLHVGPYDRELPTVQLLHDFIATNGWRATGRHHEIYLSDPRRCAPERIRTILRQPVALG